MSLTIDLRSDRVASVVPVGQDIPGLLGLVGRLNRCPTGLAFIYEALDVVAAGLAINELALVLAETPIGRQIFRRGPVVRRHGSAPHGPIAGQHGPIAGQHGPIAGQHGPIAGQHGPIVDEEVPGRTGTSDGWTRLLSSAPSGLYALPARAVDPAVSAYLVGLGASALRLDLLRHDASHDPLTGLLNRRSYEHALAEAISRTRRYGWPFALVLIDLDNFKAVNDEFGHAAGDEALRVIGTEMRAVLRRGDVAARLGGDEFALIVLNADSPAVLGPLTDRLRRALARAVPDGGIRFSAGVACFPHDALDADRLEALADERMYASKPVG